MSNLLAIGPAELIVVLFMVLLPIAVLCGLVFGIVKLIKFAWKD